MSPATARLTSVDVLRGLAVAGMILVDNPGDDDKAFWPLQHVEWNGFHPADAIFPTFLFLVGVSMVLSFSARLARHESRSDIFKHAIRRSVILIVIGLLVNAFPVYHLADWRIEGVLQRIALCYLFAAALVLWSGRTGILIATLACLFGYWALLRLAPVPGLGVPGRDIPFLDPDRNIVAWLDRKLFTGHLSNTTRDPEGLLSSIPALGTCLLGVMTGRWLQSPREPMVKVAGMSVSGTACIGVGLLWNLVFPINKYVWTSSFVVFAGGISLCALAILHWALEIRRWQGRWTIPILVLGMNPIAAFVADALVYGPGYSYSVTGADGTTTDFHAVLGAHLVPLGVGPGVASLLYSVGALLFCWLLLWLLWRRRIFLKA